jgi:hypothetical protein
LEITMATVAYSQTAVYSYGGGAPALLPIHLTYDGTTLNIYCTGDSPLAANLVSALTQATNNITLTLPSSGSATIDAALFAQLISQVVQKYYGVGAKDFPAGRTLGIAMARLGLANTATFLANL